MNNTKYKGLDLLVRLLGVFVVFAGVAFAYLDPSTGSLLLSSLVAIFASVIFFIKNVFYKIFSLVRGGGNRLSQLKEYYSLVFYSEGKQYYGVFKPILDCLDSHNYGYLFLTSDKEDPALKRDVKNAKFRYIGKGNKAFYALNTLQAEVVVLTTPGLDVLQIKRSKKVLHYCHIVHSLGSPNYRVFGMDYFDSILVNSKMQEEFIRKIEEAHQQPQKRIFNVGSTYCDELFREKLTISQNKRYFFKNQDKDIVLLSPSWGKEAILSKYGMKIIQPLIDSCYLLIIRPHPQSLISEKEVIDRLMKQTQAYQNVTWDIGKSNLYAMQESVLMISDFSGIIFDYLCLYQKPVLTIDFDFDHSGYDSADTGGIWEFDILDSIGKRIRPQDFEKISEIIQATLASSINQNILEEIKTLLWSYPQKSGVMASKILIDLCEEALQKRLESKQFYMQKLLEVSQVKGKFNE